jgi:hypothetical protein
MEKLPENIKVVPAVAACPGTVGAQTSIEVNGTGFDRVAFVLQLGVATTNGKLDAKVQNATASGGSFGDVASAALTQVTKAAGDNKCEIIDMPIAAAKPFMNLVVTTTTADFPVAAVAILYHGSRQLPITQVAGQTVTL